VFRLLLVLRVRRLGLPSFESGDPVEKHGGVLRLLGHERGHSVVIAAVVGADHAESSPEADGR